MKKVHRQVGVVGSTSASIVLDKQEVVQEFLLAGSNSEIVAVDDKLDVEPREVDELEVVVDMPVGSSVPHELAAR